jgi:hypothetical protein
MDQRLSERPWTVYLLVAWVVIGALWSLITSEGDLLLPGAWFLVAIALARFLWKGSRWAYTWSFMTSSLCLGLTAVIALIQTFLMEQTPARPVLISLVTSGALVALLMHPATKRFARIEERPEAMTAAPS